MYLSMRDVVFPNWYMGSYTKKKKEKKKEQIPVA